MRQALGVAAFVALMMAVPASAEYADDRAEWGVAVSVGADGGTPSLLVKNGTSYHLIVVDSSGMITGAGLGAMTFSDIRPGDRVDYAVTTWGGIDIADVLHVTPRRQAELHD
jgi:hypothetical protein